MSLEFKLEDNIKMYIRSSYCGATVSFSTRT